jgi:hypothetical protein
VLKNRRRFLIIKLKLDYKKKKKKEGKTKPIRSNESIHFEIAMPQRRIESDQPTPKNQNKYKKRGIPVR